MLVNPQHRANGSYAKAFSHITHARRVRSFANQDACRNACILHMCVRVGLAAMRDIMMMRNLGLQVWMWLTDLR